MHHTHIRPACLIVVLVLLAGGCANHHPGIEAYLNDTDIPSTLELRDTPFFPQEAYQCGPAALATVLVASDIGVTPHELTGKVYLPQRQGSLQLELIAASRRFGRLPYVLDGELPAILSELSTGRPVLVLQNLGLTSYPVWHYAVVIGFDASRNEIILRSGDRQRRLVADHGLVTVALQERPRVVWIGLVVNHPRGFGERRLVVLDRLEPRQLQRGFGEGLFSTQGVGHAAHVA